MQKWTCIVSQLAIYLYIKQKFIQWATRGSLNNHSNNNGLLGMKQQRTVIGFLHTSAIQAQFAILTALNGESANALNDQIGRTGTKLWTIF